MSSPAILSKHDYNIGYTRRRFLRPLVSEVELREMAELEKLCFPPPENYDVRTLRMYTSINGAGLLRRYSEQSGKLVLAAFHLFDCLSGELITLDVHPNFRRMGLGSELVAESLGKLREFGHRTVSCQIALGNEPSLKLHYGFGFKPSRKLKNYYGLGRDAYLLRAKLAVVEHLSAKSLI